MIKRRDFLKLTARLGAASLICAGKPTPTSAGELSGALPAPLHDNLPNSVEDIPFINGALNIPTFPRGPNNRGVIKSALQSSQVSPPSVVRITPLTSSAA